VTLVGHGIWLLLAWIFGALTGSQREEAPQSIVPRPTEAAVHSCANCGFRLTVQLKYCGVCGAHRPTLAEEEQLRELEITLRQWERFQQSGAIREADLEVLKARIVSEREQILFPHGRPARAKQPSAAAPDVAVPRKPPVMPQPAPSPRASSVTVEPVRAPAAQARPGEWVKDSDEAPPHVPVPPPPPRKPFGEVLAAFMEQSNIRWGEIIGGLLIIGCSTALVISLWAQISRVPTIKFLIFTTVTAGLFGIGFYTEHHWKLPTTSRRVLTIATLLLPLNFLALSAVSPNAAPTGLAVVVCEIVAPAIFLCLIYFAAKVITPKWPHLLTAGALGSSIGQILIRHLATPPTSVPLLFTLGAFPIVCY